MKPQRLRAAWRRIAGWIITRRLAAVLFSALCFLPSVCQADDLAPLFASVSRELNVPLALIQAIASVESKGQPFALHVEGKAFSFASQDEAIAAARKAFAAGKSFDAGIMQINSQWLKRFSIPLDAVFDPEANIWLGAWILGQNIRQYPDWRAVARYHSTNAARGSQYVSQVKAALAKTSADGPRQTAQRFAPLAKEKTGLNQNYFIRRMAKDFSLEPLKPPAELSNEPSVTTTASGFVRRYNR